LSSSVAANLTDLFRCTDFRPGVVASLATLHDFRPLQAALSAPSSVGEFGDDVGTLREHAGSTGIAQP